MPDIAFRRSDADYAAAYAGSLPTGAAWSRDPKSVVMQLVLGLAGPWADADARSATFINVEADPRATVELIEEWERAFGLPDPCVKTPLTLDDRRAALINKITTEGGQSRAFFIAVAALLGYSIEIIEWSPYMAGISRAGDTRSDISGPYIWNTGDPALRSWWRVKVHNRRLSWFRAARGRAGVDPHLRISPSYQWFRAGESGGHAGVEHHLEGDIAEDLQCVFHRWKPAHTLVTFDYTGEPVIALGDYNAFPLILF